jgi:ATP-dependent DNA helicase RecG
MSDRRFKPRAMMEKAIEVMLQSVAEPRDDKATPKVGAVLIPPYELARQIGPLLTACRGELREGDHAEFTLIERKCRDKPLDDSILFTTLEPCAPGSRSERKLGCAERIVLARIKEVWVGIEDDNPAVAGKGIEHLQRHGVTVHMFDRDLQEVILSENREFFEWARQQVDEPKKEPIQLSKYEDSVSAVNLQDLSPEALDLYRSRASIKWELDSEEFGRMLRQQGILVEAGGEIVPSGFGLLLFGKEPALALPQARLLARADLPNGKASREEFSQALVLIPGKVEEWLNMVLPSTIDRSRMERKEAVDLPFEMIREAVINALIHRDYDLVGEKCHLVVNSETITITSPGGPIPPITLDQMRSFSAPMKSRNPILHHVFSRMGLAEEQGYGLTSLKERAEEHGLPLPSFSMDGGSLVLTIYRSAESATESLDDEIRQKLNTNELKGFQWLAKQDTVTRREYQIAMKIGPRAGGLQLQKFIDLGIAERIGAGRATKYRATK